jgi:hypothetical protein
MEQTIHELLTKVTLVDFALLAGSFVAMIAMLVIICLVITLFLEENDNDQG